MTTMARTLHQSIEDLIVRIQGLLNILPDLTQDERKSAVLVVEHHFEAIASRYVEITRPDNDDVC